MKNLKKIFRFVKPYQGLVLLTLMFNILATVFSISVIGLIIPFLNVLFGTSSKITVPPEHINSINSLIDYSSYFLGQMITKQGPILALFIICTIAIATSFFRNLFTYLGTYYMAPIRNGIIRDMRVDMYNKILHLPLAYFSNQRKGDLITRMTSDLQEVEWSITASLVIFIREPIKILSLLVVLVAMSPQLSIFAMVLLPISGYLIGRLGKKLKRFSNKGQIQMSVMISAIEETLSGVRIIKAFNAEKKMGNRFKEINKSYNKIMNVIFQRRDLGAPASEFFSTIAMVLIIWYGGYLILGQHSNLKPELFIGYILFFSQIIAPAKSFSQAFYNIRKGSASIDRINEVLNTPNPITEIDEPIDIKSFNTKIEYKNVSFKYSENDVLKNINLTIDKGKTIAIVGESGSGKSTMVDLIPRFYDVIAGELLIDGIPIKDLKIKSLRNLFGIVNQEPILFNDSVQNNILFGVDYEVESEKVVEAAKIANAYNFIVEMPEQFESNIGDRGSKLSGGQRQRLSIARAILKNPPILILDEATSALDTESEKLVQEALSRLMENRTSIVIAHRLSTVINADEIVVLHEGEIVERGTHEELIKIDGKYKRFYELQMQ